jgi:D-alanyl-D-alanine dipeptidase
MRKTIRFWRHAVFAVLSAMLCSTAFLAHSAQLPKLVNIKKQAPTIIVDIPYATENNFTGIKLYTHNVCLLQPAVADAVEAAHAEALSLGYRLKMLDCYRPKSVSLAMWQAGLDHNRACRDLGPVCKSNGCDPARPDCLWEPLTNYMSRNSKHNRGATVDITLVTIMGRPVDMGAAFDHFGPESRTNNATGKSLENRMLLKRIMQNHGFSNYFREWWHYNHNSYSRYAVMDVPLADYVNGH